MGLQFDYSFWIVLAGSGLMGLTAGTLGSFAFLRRQSMLGDTISHAALPGVVLAFLLILEKNSFLLLGGAIFTSMLSLLFLRLILMNTPLKEDAALGITLSIFFGVGIMLLTFAQKISSSNQAGLNNFLFGNATALLFQDLALMSVLSIISLMVVVFLWKEFTLFSFDKGFAAALGWPIFRIELLLGLLLVIAIVIGLESIGIILMSALIATPAACAAQWTRRMGSFVLFAGLLAFSCAVLGVVISGVGEGLPTGPVTVSLLSLFLVFSLFFSPRQGFFSRLWKQYRKQRREVIIGNRNE